MFKSKKKNKSEESNDLLLYTASLLIHASKIDENYTDNELAYKKNINRFRCRTFKN